MSLKPQTRLIHEFPWNTLIILDACRADAFQQVYQDYLVGEYETVRSPASCTRYWLRETWIDEDYSDITYISCNVFMQQHTRKHKWQYPYPERFKRIIDVWKEGLMPEHVEKYALTTPGRKVIHYNFPHHPYYGEEKDPIYEGHVDNLRFILSYLVTLLPKLRKPIVLTSDHGDIFEPGMVYHPCSKERNDLRNVPWFLYENIKELREE